MFMEAILDLMPLFGVGFVTSLRLKIKCKYYFLATPYLRCINGTSSSLADARIKGDVLGR